MQSIITLNDAHGLKSKKGSSVSNNARATVFSCKRQQPTKRPCVERFMGVRSKRQVPVVSVVLTSTILNKPEAQAAPGVLRGTGDFSRGCRGALAGLGRKIN